MVCSSKFAQDITHQFFVESCVAALQIDNIECPIDEVDGFAVAFIDPLRFDAMAESFGILLFQVMVMQTGGIPRCEGVLGVAFFVVYTLVTLAQWFSQLSAVVMTGGGYVSLRSDFGECMQPWAHGMKLLDDV